MRLGIVCLLLLLLSAAVSPAATGTASLLLDIAPSVNAYRSEDGARGPLLPAGPVALLTAGAPSSGQELWASDGTTGGTQGLRDICPGPCSVLITQEVGQIGRTAVFYLEGGPVLWRSDGTRAGTFPLGATMAPQPCSAEAGTVIGGVLFFAGRTDECNLWRTDGTAAGTRQVTSFTSLYGSFLGGLTAVAGKLYFAAEDETGPALWQSDGTAAGTVAVRRLQTLPRFLAAAGARLYFVAHDDGDELWTSDGTPAGTRPLTHFTAPKPFPDSGSSERRPFVHAVDGALYFLADDVTGGLDLWRSDGTPAGTRRVTAFGNATPFSNVFSEQQIAKLGGRLIFVATDGINGFRLWTSGGTPETTAPLQACPGGACPTLEANAELVKMGDRLVFPAAQPGKDAAAWSTDGTAAGTHPVQASCPRHCGPKILSFAKVAGRVLFVLGDDSIFRQVNRELWQTDGTAAGTRWLATLTPFYQFMPRFEPVAAGDRALFVEAEQLWASDGTPEGTGPVTRIGNGGFGSFPRDFAATGSAAWLIASDGESSGLWRSEGTPETTRKVVAAEIASPDDGDGSLSLLRVARGLAFFLHYDGNGRELWRADGTPAGTLALTPPNVDVLHFFPFKDRIGCLVREPDGTRSLWDSDGTPAGTRRLFALPWSNSIRINDVASVGPFLLILTDNFNTLERFLWRSDGTAAGTRSIDLGGAHAGLRGAVRLGDRIVLNGTSSHFDPQIYTLADAEDSLQPFTGYRAHEMAVFRGALYFFMFNRLMRSDLTAQGTVVL